MADQAAVVHGYCIAGATQPCVFTDLTIVADDAPGRWPVLPLGGGYIAPLWAGGAGNDRVFRERAVVVLTAYLAAAHTGRTAHALLRWATVQPKDQPDAERGRFLVDKEPVELLRQHHRTELADNLDAEMRMDPRTASAVRGRAVVSVGGRPDVSLARAGS